MEKDEDEKDEDEKGKDVDYEEDDDIEATDDDDDKDEGEGSEEEDTEMLKLLHLKSKEIRDLNIARRNLETTITKLRNVIADKESKIKEILEKMKEVELQSKLSKEKLLEKENG